MIRASELAGRAIEGESLAKDHLGRMARSVDGDLMPDDHLVAGVEEGHGAAAGIEQRSQRDHERPDLLESSIRPRDGEEPSSWTTTSACIAARMNS